PAPPPAPLPPPKIEEAPPLPKAPLVPDEAPALPEPAPLPPPEFGKVVRGYLFARPSFEALPAPAEV
ncbi:MAG: energy transducer TonB, partial [Planctomycetota bacterium]